MNPASLLTFWGVTFFLIVVPGPDWVFILAAGAGHRVVLPAVGGLMLGYSLLTLLVAAGVAGLVERSPLVLTALTIVGAGYLTHLGISILRHPGVIHASDKDRSHSPLLRGIGVSALNPKGLLIFLALLPQFTDPDGAWPLRLQLAALGLMFVLTCGVFYVVVGYSAARILDTRPQAARLSSRASGGAMIIVGLVLVLERLIFSK